MKGKRVYSETKYHARSVEWGGHRFASQAECRRAQELELLQRAGEITDLEYQPAFVLVPRFRYQGKGHYVRPIMYVADFIYRENGQQIVEDVKGFETPVWKLKQKMFWYKYPDIELRVIS